ncbi:PREDICTED: uncharacterized protein LOC18599763 [Theobroma cacao]|uniref:Uncharacterized protein LOC18599763 n=1 Tax=Theobroma cacao TaxID=3641 RepID=A0AB32V5L5_THECC|nr:PREDICTED: uncharacterized protein LOC18599763 [Theobroma cacao]
MFYPFFCGAFHHQKEDDDELWSTPASTPKKSRRKKDSKNPYSTRGLDQFSALLAELEEKRQQIYSQMGSEGIVRFVYKNSNDCVPVVVKLKDKKEEKNKTEDTKDHHPESCVSEVVEKLPTPPESDEKIEQKKSFSWNIVKSQDWRRPSYYIPAVIISILLFLVFFGRSVAILCTCMGWYVVPTISGEGSNLRTSMKKKDYVRKLSGNKMVSGKLSSPKNNKFGAIRDKSPR